ncbi:MAG TPA: hypothetical protein VGD33_01840 [Chitinophagaceae bacterium]
MKKLKQFKPFLLLLAATLVALTSNLFGQDEKAEEPEAPEKLVKLRYFNQDNNLQYILVESQLKTGKKIEPRPQVAIKLYLDSIGTDRLIAAMNTGTSGKAKVIIPPAMKETWDAASKHSFIVVETPAEKDAAEVTTSFDIEKAKLSIDTSYEEGVRSVTVKVMRLENGEWLPANEVEMKVGVERLGGILTGGGEETYTTDSSGMVTLEFTRTGIPGNEKGDIVLMARVDDNEYFGNLQLKRTVPWGVATKVNTHFFDQRTLWSTRQNAPIWLMLLAYSIMASVWGVLIYLVIQLFRIKKLGKAAAAES